MWVSVSLELEISSAKALNHLIILTTHKIVSNDIQTLNMNNLNDLII